MTVKRVGIFGTSGMAREAGDVANDLGYTPLYVARDQAELNNWNFPAEAILESDVLRYQNIPFVIGIGENNIREKVANRYREQLSFCNLIHTSATFGYLQRKVIECQQGIIVCAGVRFTNSIQVGNFCIFNGCSFQHFPGRQALLTRYHQGFHRRCDCFWCRRGGWRLGYRDYNRKRNVQRGTCVAS